MFTLIALGTGAAYGYSVVATLAPGLFPRVVPRPRGRGRRLLRGGGGHHDAGAARPGARAPRPEPHERRDPGPARPRADDGAARARRRDARRTCRSTEVAVGDRLRVRPGEKVPGRRRRARGHERGRRVDDHRRADPGREGARRPRSSAARSTAAGALRHARRAGRAATRCSRRSSSMVGEAQRSRAPIQRLADRVSACFVPAVVVAAVRDAFVVWARCGPEPRLAHALVNAVAVLIIACPCALGLATPMSIMVGTGRGAHGGRPDQERRGARDAREGRHARRRQDRHADRGQARRLVDGRGAAAASDEDRAPAPGGEPSSGRASIRSRRAIVAGAREARGAGARRGRRLPRRDRARACSGPGRRAGRVALGNARLLDDGSGVDARRRSSEQADALRAGRGRPSMFVAVDGRPAGLLGGRRPDQADHGRGAPALRADGHPRRHAHRRQPRARPRRWPGSSASTRSRPRSCPSGSSRSSGACRREGRIGGDGRRRHQRRPGAGRRPTSASRWAPAPTSPWRAPA